MFPVYAIWINCDLQRYLDQIYFKKSENITAPSLESKEASERKQKDALEVVDFLD